MNKFIITEEEKNRILGMHKSATSNHYLMEQGNTNFINEIMSDLEKLGFVKTGIVGGDWDGFISSNQHPGKYYQLKKGNVGLIFNEGSGLLIITVGTRISISNMGSDNLSNSSFAKSFKAYDNGKNVLDGGIGTGPEENVNFIYWLTTNLTPNNTFGTTKESTPFYTQYYPDIVKLTQIDDKFSKFGDSSLKDQAKAVGQEIGKGLKAGTQKLQNLMGNLKSKQ